MSVPLELYHGATSMCSSKVRIGLAEKGLDWISQPVNLKTGEQNGPDYLKLNPLGVVPTLVHGDLVVVESSVILETSMGSPARMWPPPSSRSGGCSTTCRGCLTRARDCRARPIPSPTQHFSPMSTGSTGSAFAGCGRRRRPRSAAGSPPRGRGRATARLPTTPDLWRRTRCMRRATRCGPRCARAGRRGGPTDR
ncbi:MAG TPA: hypothetical protein DIU07_02275, partial [Rhodobacteraceae bacterium]|nr:hypothetical protein [Paracoccaceae bacterium]